MSLTNRILISLGLMALAGFAVLLNPILDRVERQYLEATKQRLIQLGILAVALVLLLCWLLSKWVTFPLRRLTEYAAAVAKRERPPAPVMPGRHLRILGETTEAMREALENRKYVESYVQSLTVLDEGPGDSRLRPGSHL